MGFSLLDMYDRWVLGRPVPVLVLAILFVAGVGVFARDFKLDASSDSLMLQGDEDLRYYRSIRDRYGADDFLVVTYRPAGDLFSRECLTALVRLRADLLALECVASVTSILDVPLIDSPRVSLEAMADGARTLADPDTDPALARREFLTSPLYRSLLVSPDARTTAIQVHLRQDEAYRTLTARRHELREREAAGELSDGEARELAEVIDRIREHNTRYTDRQRADIAAVRAVLAPWKEKADIHLGGVPMIVADMIDFIRHDLAVFGVGVLVFLTATLAVIFRKPRWVVLPMLCCLAAVVFMFGFLGLVQWRVTVVSSNFTSLLLIVTLSLTVHLVVRYHELFAERPGADQRSLVRETVRSKALPSLYTALTTIVAFASLLVSDIRPVIDFGWMMAIGIGAAFVLAFLFFPSGLVLLPPGRFQPRHDLTGGLVRGFEGLVERRGTAVLGVFGLLAVLAVAGLTRMTVENRFVDHFKASTEIYQGMELIDRELGGTTPLEVIVDADPAFLEWRREAAAEEAAEEEDEWGEEAGDAGLSATSYWYNVRRLDLLEAVQAYLDDLPESGKVLSLATTMALLQHLNDDEPLNNFVLSVLHRKLPPDVKEALFDPYMSEDGNQARFYLRVFETDPNLRRSDLLARIREGLSLRLGFADDQLHLTGMFVLYNNVLRSLFRSQILTLGFVFVAIMAMFFALFRSLRLAAVAIAPNLFSAGAVLGLMGWLAIPLDIMTITIAAITIGIAVDDTIHYVHRYTEELARDGDRLAAVRRCHRSVGRAMCYTSCIVIAGFSILVFSSFMPTLYFGLFTGLAMAVAMVANLTLLAVLLVRFGPRKS
jgi:predicted RND superfamily exporter protein